MFDIEPTYQLKRGEKFVESFPVGSLVVDTSVLLTHDLTNPYAWTAGGEVYEKMESTQVNVRDINGVKDTTGTWSTTFLQKGVLRTGSPS